MRTGLHLAALLGTEQAAGALLRHGADMTARWVLGITGNPTPVLGPEQMRGPLLRHGGE